MKLVLLLFYNIVTTNSWAHGGAISPHDNPWLVWKFQPHILIMLFLMGLIYYLGFHRMIKLRGHDAHKLRKSSSSYYAGLFILLIALISPVDTMSDSLAWVHMLQHTLILMVAAPLMALGGPAHISQWSLSKKVWARLGNFRLLLTKFFQLSRFKRPFVAWALYMLVLSIWHIPLFYEAALKWERIHDLQHLLFFVTSFFFWRVLFDPYQKGIRPMIGIIYTFIASIHGIILGVLMTVSPIIWYGPYIESAPRFGYDPLIDQQIAGLIMWMPAGISYALGALALLLRELKSVTPSP